MKIYIYILLILLVSCKNNSEIKISHNDSTSSTDKHFTLRQIALNRKPLPYVPEVYGEGIVNDLPGLFEKRKEIENKIKATLADTIPPWPEKEKRVNEFNRLYFITEDFIAKKKYETLCHVIDNSQPVEDYDGTLGVTKSFVELFSKSVGQLQWKYNFGNDYDLPTTRNYVRGKRWGTGCLISKNLFITAGHCFDREANGWELPKKNSEVVSNKELATLMKVNFNYELDRTTRLIRKDTIEYPVLELKEYRFGDLDYAIV